MSPTTNRITIRDLGYSPGIFTPGRSNSILDVPGVHLSQLTLPTPSKHAESTAAKGVTLILPRPPKDFYKPCHAGTFTFNGNGEMTASRQIADWGFINMPIAFTNSLSLGPVFEGVWDWALNQQDALGWDALTKARHYGTPVVGETADWMINSDLRASKLSTADVRRAFDNLKSLEDGGAVREGQKGGGAGMTCHMFAGGTGSASRVVGGGHGSEREYTVGVICQTNYGRLVELSIGGVPIGKLLEKEKEGQPDVHGQGADVHAPPSETAHGGRVQDGSILVLIITDAPLLPHQLARLARHATAGLALVGTYGVGRTHSGDIFLAVSTADHGPEQLEGTDMRRINPTQTYKADVVKNESIDAYTYAAKEASEEAILNSIVGGRSGTVGVDGKLKIDGFPVERVKQLLAKHLVKV